MYGYLFYKANTKKEKKYITFPSDFDQENQFLTKGHEAHNLNYYYPLYYRMAQSNIKEKISAYVSSVIIKILHDKEVEEEGVKFISKLFDHKDTHEAGLILLKNVL